MEKIFCQTSAFELIRMQYCDAAVKSANENVACMGGLGRRLGEEPGYSRSMYGRPWEKVRRGSGGLT